jgi:flagellar biosynthesis protein FlhB
MAEQKNLPATSRKIKRAREEGDVAKSRDITGAIAIFTAFLFIFFSLIDYQRVVAFSIKTFSQDKDFISDSMLLFIKEAMLVWAWMVIPCLVCILVVVFMVESLQVGLNFSLKPLGFKLSRLSFFQGLKRIFGFQNSDNGSLVPTQLFYELVKMIFYLVVFVLFFGGILFHLWLEAIAGDYESISDLLTLLQYGGIRIAGIASVVLLVVGVVDLLVVRSRRLKRLRMNISEFRREHRENEGSPEMKGLRKSLHQEMLLQGALDGIRRAKVVVVSDEREQ